jgi:hypothetical protein
MLRSCVILDPAEKWHGRVPLADSIYVCSSSFLGGLFKLIRNRSCRPTSRDVGSIATPDSGFHKGSCTECSIKDTFSSGGRSIG